MSFAHRSLGEITRDYVGDRGSFAMGVPNIVEAGSEITGRSSLFGPALIPAQSITNQYNRGNSLRWADCA
jgi:hypothetical protein